MIVDNVEILQFNLRRVRKNLGFSQGELADSIEVKRTTYARYEKDVIPPDDVLRKIAKKHKVDFVEFSKAIPEDRIKIKKKSCLDPNGTRVELAQVEMSEAEIDKLRKDLEQIAPLGQQYIAMLQKELATAQKYIEKLEKGEKKSEHLIELQDEKIKILEEKLMQLSAGKKKSA